MTDRKIATPLVIDLDGTLIRGDLFIEAILRFVLAAPLNVFRLAKWLIAGRATAKAHLARLTPCDPAHLPYDERLVDWIRSERAAGREIILATAADRAEATAVANHLGLFDTVIASDGVTNLKSKAKADRLRRLYPDGFVYAGNERADLNVWAAADAAVLVNTPHGLAKTVERHHQVEQVFPAKGGALRSLIKAIRPQQWAKNALVFVPMLVGHGAADIEAWRGAIVAFLALSATASSVYLVNDAADISADRRHHRKRNRPFASGRLSPVLGLGVSAGLVVAGLALGHAAGVLWLTVLYLVSSSLYTFWLKRRMLVDVFVLAGLYMIRILSGGVAASSPHADYTASSWLLAFSCFFFLSLALVKRVIEVEAVAAQGGGDLANRGYRGSDGGTLKIMGVAAGFVSALVLALYLQSDIVAMRFTEPFFLWALPAVIVYWQCRIWLMTDRGEVHDDPLVFAVGDRITWVAAVIAAASFGAAMVMPDSVITWR